LNSLVVLPASQRDATAACWQVARAAAREGFGASSPLECAFARESRRGRDLTKESHSPIPRLGTSGALGHSLVALPAFATGRDGYLLARAAAREGHGASPSLYSTAGSALLPPLCSPASGSLGGSLPPLPFRAASGCGVPIGRRARGPGGRPPRSRLRGNLGSCGPLVRPDVAARDNR